jgi:hypothetical protein
MVLTREQSACLGGRCRRSATRCAAIVAAVSIGLIVFGARLF